jgi:hypothetical protein
VDAPKPVRETPPPALWLHFGILGLVGAWLLQPPFADTYRWSRLAQVVRALPAEALLVTPIVTGVLGAAMARLVTTAGPRPWRALGMGTVAACVSDAVILCAAARERLGGRLTYDAALAAGLLGAVACFPALAVVFGAARLRGRARAGSRVDRCDARRPWLPTLAIVAGAAAARLACPFAPPDGSLASLAVACVSLGLLFALDARDLRNLWQPASGAPGATPTIDFGLGEEEETVSSRPNAAYRDAPRVLAFTRGNVATAKAVLLRIVAADAAALAVCAVVALSAAVGGPSPGTMGPWDGDATRSQVSFTPAQPRVIHEPCPPGKRRAR